MFLEAGATQSTLRVKQIYSVAYSSCRRFSASLSSHLITYSRKYENFTVVSNPKCAITVRE